MKAFHILPFAVAALLACDRIVSEPAVEPGILALSFAPDETRGFSDIPDTNSFRLDIRTADGSGVWSGTWAEAPKELSLKPGSYTVEAVSGAFDEPLFEAPQYGDKQTVTLESGKVAAVHLSCAQLNASVRIQQTEQFMADYPGGTFYVQSSAGTLVYSYGEKRTGCFPPGTIWVVLRYGGVGKTLATREISHREVLVLRFGSGGSVMQVGPVAERYGDGLTMEVDTSRTWTLESLNYGAGGITDGNVEDLSGAYSVGQARAKAASGSGEKGVWVWGYIAGGDCTSASCSFTAPFKNNGNLLLAPSKDSADKNSCLAVQLSPGDIRDALNLVDHPELLGRLVYLKGSLVEKYYGIPGLHSLTSFRLP